MVFVDNSEADSLLPKAPEYGDANSILNGGPQNAAPPAPPPITPSYVDTSYQQPQPSYSPPAPSQSAYGLNYGSANNGDANNDGLNDQTGWANGVVQDYSSPSGFSYNGIPTTSDGAPYNPGPQQPSYESGYNLDFASPLGGTANDAPVRPYIGERIYQNPDTGGTTIHPGDQQFNPDMSYPPGSAEDAMAKHPNGGPSFLDTLGNIAGTVGDALSINPFNAPARPNADPNQSFLGALGHANNVALQDWQTPLVPSETIQNIPGFDRIPGGNYLADFISGSTSPIGAFSIPAGNAAGELIGAGTAGILGDTALTRILGAGATGAALNTGLTGFNQATTGTFDPQELAKQAAIGFGLGAAIPAVGEGVRGVRGLHDTAIALDRRINEPVPGGAFGKPVTKGMVRPSDNLQEVLTAKYPNVRLAITERKLGGEPVLEVHNVVVPSEMRGGGIGSQVMRDITDWADQNGYTIRLDADPSIGGVPKTAGNVKRLQDWYESLGFVKNSGKTKDFELADPFAGNPMYRRPQATEIPNVMPEGDMGAGIPTKLGRGGKGATPNTTTFTGPMPKPADLGDSGIRAALGTKEATTREAGPIGEVVGKIPGVKKAAGVVNPSINLERPIHVANQAEAAVKAELSTKFAATRKPMLDEIKASGLDGGVDAPEYIGPAKNPIKNTFIDRVENPQDYRLTQPQKNLIQRIATRDAENVNLARGQYNADVGLYAPKNEGAAYVPHINSNEDIIQRSAKAEAALTNPRIAKERVYDTARERAIASDKFKPETDPARLLEAHDNAIANMAGKETFKAGAGGLNKADVLAKVAPQLVERRDALMNKIDSLSGRLETAERRAGIASGKAQELQRPLDRLQSSVVDKQTARSAIQDARRELQSAKRDALSEARRAGGAVAKDQEARAQFQQAQARADAALTRLQKAQAQALGLGEVRPEGMGIRLPEVKADAVRAAVRDAELSSVELRKLAGKTTMPTNAEAASNRTMLERGAAEISAKQAADNLKTAMDNALSAANESAPADVHSAMRAMEGRITTLEKRGGQYQNTADGLRNQLQTARDQYEQVANAWRNVNLQERGYELSPYTYKYHSPEEAASIASVKQTSNGALDKPIAFGETARATVLGGDLSPVTIQGQMNLWRDPVSTAIGVAKMVRQGGVGLEDVVRAEPDLVARYTRATGHALGNVSPEFSPNKSILAKIPKVGPVFAAMDEKMFGAMQRIQYESWKRNVDFVGKLYKNTPQDVIDHEVANALSKTVPGLSSVERGLSPARASVERAGLTSPSFLAAPALVAKDAASGIVKALAAHPRSITPRELVAMKQIVTIAGMVEAVSLTSAVLNADNRGLSPEDAIKKALTPGDRTFLAIQAGGYTAPLGGPFRSMINGLAPKYRNGEWQAPDLLQFAKSKIAPVPGTAIDLLQNSDYYGNKIRQGDPLEQLGRVAEYIGENIGLPLTAGAVAEGIRTGRGLGETLQNAGSQALGSNVNSASPYEDRDVQARKAYGKNWNDLSPVEQNALKAVPGSPAAAYASTNPDAVASAKATETIKADAAKAQTSIDAKYTRPGETVPKSYNDGQNWRDEYHKNQYATLREYRLKDQLMPYGGAQSTNEMRQAVDQYFATVDANTSGTAVNWDAVDKWLADHPDIAKQVDLYQNDPNKPNTDYSPMVTAYKKASSEIGDSGYFDIKDKAFQQLAAKGAAGLSNYPTYDDWYQAQTQKLVDKGIPQAQADKIMQSNPLADVIGQKAAADRYQWVRSNPALAAEAINWGYLKPNNAEIAFLKARGVLR